MILCAQAQKLEESNIMRIESNSTTAHPKEQIGYRNQKQIQNNKIRKQNLMMFLSVFAVLLLVFLGIARIMSPDVDISLGDDNTKTEEHDDNYRRSVDSRLRMLQEDDDMNLLEHDQDESLIEEDGIVRLPKIGEKTMLKLDDDEPVQTRHNDDEELNKSSETSIEHTTNTATNETNASASKSSSESSNKSAPIPGPSKTYRVYVGMYNNQSQAEVAKGILQEAGLGVTPSVKQAAGGYTLQVGAFSSKESATNLTNKLLNNNYPARVVSD